MATVTFVYQPRSGDRVFVTAETSAIVIIGWSNGCRHVVGGRHLSVSAAQPGRHWRDRARETARMIIEAVGGIAWDDQGTVSLIVPEWAAPRTATLLRAAAVAAGAWLLPGEEDTLALSAGARLDPVSGRWVWPARWNQPAGETTYPEVQVFYEETGETFEGGKVHICVTFLDGERTAVRVPRAWGEPRIPDQACTACGEAEGD